MSPDRRPPTGWIPLVGLVILEGWGPTLRAALLLGLLLAGLAGIAVLAGPLATAGLVGTAMTTSGVRKLQRRDGISASTSGRRDRNAGPTNTPVRTS